MTPENKIKNSICEYLSYRPDIFFWPQETQGTFDPIRKVYRKSNNKYKRIGIPDIIVLMRINNTPIFIGLEVKTKTGRQTPSQVQFESDLGRFTPGFYFVVRDVSQVIEALKQIYVKITSCAKA